MTHHSDFILSQNLLIFEGFIVRSFSLRQILVLSELERSRVWRPRYSLGWVSHAHRSAKNGDFPFFFDITQARVFCEKKKIKIQSDSRVLILFDHEKWLDEISGRDESFVGASRTWIPNFRNIFFENFLTRRFFLPGDKGWKIIRVRAGRFCFLEWGAC